MAPFTVIIRRVAPLLQVLCMLVECYIPLNHWFIGFICTLCNLCIDSHRNVSLDGFPYHGILLYPMAMNLSYLIHHILKFSINPQWWSQCNNHHKLVIKVYIRTVMIFVVVYIWFRLRSIGRNATNDLMLWYLIVIGYLYIK